MTIERKISYTLAAPDADGICEAQQTAGATALVLDGVLVNADTDVFTVSDKCPKLISITSTGNLSGTDFTMVYQASDTSAVTTQVRAGPNNNTVTFTEYVYRLISITPDDAVGTDITVGTSAACISQVFDPDPTSSTHSVSVQVLSGTATVTLQHTLCNPFVEGLTTEAAAAWLNNDATVPLVDLTSGQTAAVYDGGVAAMRMKVTTYSSTPVIIFRIHENVKV